MRTWVVIVAVKPLAAAKTRLALEADLREPLAMALAADTVRAALDCTSVREVVVVTDDDRVSASMRAAGAHVVADGPAAGLNAALRHGAGYARERSPGVALAALVGDLPALTPRALADVLSQAAAVAVGFVADAAGTGTTLLSARAGAGFSPEFGPGSAAAHRASGAVPLRAAEGMRQDVDTIEDLRASMSLGVGPRTAAAALAALSAL